VPRSEARIFTSIWKDEDFLALPATTQRLYMFLVSQEDLTHCGVIPLRVPRWTRKAADLKAAEIEADLELLAAGAHPFVVIDEDTGELFVRSLIRHDQVWKQPNVMKAARESAALIESRAIRTALLSELLRIPAQESESVHVRKVHAAFVDDLQEGSGNPSPNPSGNGSGNPSADPSANGSADPSQGKGEGYGPVLEVSPNPRAPSPSPRASAHEGVRPLFPHAVPDLKPEEERETRETPDLDSLVAEIRQIRSDWSTQSIKRALTSQSVTERPWVLVRAAALAVARDPESKQPGRLAHDGPWWAQPQSRKPPPLDPGERHSYEPGNEGGCAKCRLPESNRRHMEAS